MTLRTYQITPVSKPRMTQRDRWKKRPSVVQYYAFKDDCAENNITVPESGSHVVFVMPMPQSWTNKKKEKMNGAPHQQRPDVDNLVKALLDAVYLDDSCVWDIRASKKWGYSGQIIIKS